MKTRRTSKPSKRRSETRDDTPVSPTPSARNTPDCALNPPHRFRTPSLGPSSPFEDRTNRLASVCPSRTFPTFRFRTRTFFAVVVTRRREVIIISNWKKREREREGEANSNAKREREKANALFASPMRRERNQPTGLFLLYLSLASFQLLRVEEREEKR